MRFVDFILGEMDSCKLFSTVSIAQAYEIFFITSPIVPHLLLTLLVTQTKFLDVRLAVDLFS